MLREVAHDVADFGGALLDAQLRALKVGDAA
jgi:hypothetical protein